MRKDDVLPSSSVQTPHVFTILFSIVSVRRGVNGFPEAIAKASLQDCLIFFIHQVVVRCHGYQSVARCFQHPFGSIPTYVEERTEVRHLHATILGYSVTEDLELAGTSRKPSLRMLFKKIHLLTL